MDGSGDRSVSAGMGRHRTGTAPDWDERVRPSRQPLVGRLGRFASNSFRTGSSIRMKHCKLCHFSSVCNDLPWVCILIPYLTVAVVAVSLGYLFVTQELLT